ncbi:hypothetical protein HWV62_14312 [Athelia sp. TMB]|nr:hypothetical protein HWV62_14312 [Athelia sp. TMB]
MGKEIDDRDVEEERARLCTPGQLVAVAAQLALPPVPINPSEPTLRFYPSRIPAQSREAKPWAPPSLSDCVLSTQVIDPFELCIIETRAFIAQVFQTHMASMSVEPSFVTTLDPSDQQMDFYEEEEVDQLDSDSDTGDQPDESSASSKGYNRAEGRRIPGQTLLPSARMDSIINAGDTIPHPMSLSDALERREMKEKEDLDLDPAVSTSTLVQPMASLSTAPSNHSFAPKPKVKARPSNGNGKEKANGSASAAKREGKKRGRAETNGDAHEAVRASSRPNRGTRAAPREEWPDIHPAEPVSSHPTGSSVLAAGVSPYRYARQPQWAAGQVTMRSDDFVEDPHSRRVDQYVPPPPREENDGWTGGQFSTGFLQQPFPRAAPNPGRTIYSQQQQHSSSYLITSQQAQYRYSLFCSSPFTSAAHLVDVTMGESIDKSHSLPIIDITPYLDGHNPHGRLSTSSAIHAACLEYGFFYLRIDNYVDPSEPEELTKLAREFFALPEEEKIKISLKNQDGARGYARLKENVTNGKADNHEGIDFYRPVDNPDKDKPLWGENQWPTVPGFRDKYEAWMDKMTDLGLIVMEAMATGLGMSPEEWQELRTQVDKSFWVMRVIGEPRCMNASLGTDQVDALSTDTNAEDGIWINADPIEGCVVVNIGEMWEVWTNGLYKSTLHRVVHRGSNYRVSIPFFFEPNFDARVEVLPAARRLLEIQSSDKESGKKYEPVVYGDFLMKKVGGNFAEGKGKYD